MNLGYWIVVWVVIVEFALIIAIVVATYFARLVMHVRNARSRRLSRVITRYLMKILTRYPYIDSKHVPNHWQRLDILLPIVRQLDLQKDELTWQNNRTIFIKSVMLPLARTETSSFDWVSRLLATQTFTLLPELDDEKYIVQLVMDEVPLIRYSALMASIMFASEAAINLIITQMADEPWLSQSLYLARFDNANIETRIFIVERLKKTLDDKTRSACYKILLKYPRIEATWDVKADIVPSSHPGLRLSALRFLAYTDRETAIPLLIEALKEPSWEMRTIVLHCLGDLNAVEAIPEITICLNDLEKWVGLAAAETLYRLGDKGMQVLLSQNIQTNRVAYNIANHVFDIEE